MVALLAGSTQASARAVADPATRQSVAMAAGNDVVINTRVVNTGRWPLPEDTVSLLAEEDGSVVAVSRNGVMTPMGFWDAAWRWTKCVASVALVVLPASKAYKAIRAFGGVTTTARLLWGAGNATEASKILGGAASDILGIPGVQANCFG